MATAAQRAKAEARAVIQDDGTTLVPLDGKMVGVLSVQDWRQSALSDLGDNRFDLWAKKCLTPAGYLVWAEIDPTFRQCEDFFAAWKERTGQDVGESQAS